MPGKLTDNDTRVSSLFQYMRPRPNNLILTNTIVSGDFQVKGSAIIPNLTVNNLVISDTTISTSKKGITLKYKNGSIDDTIYYNVSGVIAKPNAVSCGDQHTAILLNTGKVVTFGSGTNGRLGDGQTTGRTSPTAVTDASGYDSSNAIAVSCGDSHTAILLNTGKVLTFGGGARGQLGTGNTTSYSSPTDVSDTSGYNYTNAVAVSCGQSHTAILLNTGKVLTFGYGVNYVLGNGTTTQYNSPYGVTDASGYDSSNAIAVSCGGEHTAILLNTGKVVTFGRGDNGELGNGNSNRSVPYGVMNTSGYDSSNAVAVACGLQHTAILLNTGQVVTFGNGGNGRLGNGNSNRSVPYGVTDASGYNSSNAVAISCGWQHTTVLLNTGNVVTFGWGNTGQLGTGDTTDRYSPYGVTDASGYNSSNAVAVSAGNRHTSILLNTGQIVTFGEGGNGALGTGDTTDRSSPYSVADASGYVSNNALTVSKYTINTGFDLSQNFSGGIQDNFNQITTNHKLNNYERSFIYDNSDISITATLPVNNSSFRKSGTY